MLSIVIDIKHISVQLFLLHLQLSALVKLFKWNWHRHTSSSCIYVREHRTANQKLTIQRNWQHRVHKTKKNKAKTHHNMCWTLLCANKHE